MSNKLSDLPRILERRKQALIDNVGAATYRVGLQIAGDAQEKHVPIDTGFLAGSLYVMPPKIVGQRVTTGVGSGARYAAAVHELQTPYLRLAVEENEGRMAEIFEIFLEAAIEKGQVIRPQASGFPTSPGPPDDGGE